jgi:hypothetical protein
MKADLQRNQRVLVKMCFQLDSRRIVPAFGRSFLGIAASPAKSLVRW